MSLSTDFSFEHAQSMDVDDELATYRDRFVIADPNLVYLDGNSLGRLPKNTHAYMQQTIEQQWGDRLIRSWNETWFGAPQRIGAKIASVIGAGDNEVLVADSTSVNLFKLAQAALNLQTDRSKIITDDLNFPSDIYILQGILSSANREYELQVIKSKDGIHGPQQDILDAIDENTAFVTLTHTAFKSSFTYDIAAITEKAHQKGALVIWDLSHSAGAVPVDLNAAGADLAVGCTYKYLNGGPGAPAFLFVREDLQNKLINPISGWMGQKNLFDFGLDYEPEDGIRRLLSGTPPILSLCAIEPGVDLISEVGVAAIRRKSLGLSDYLIELWQHFLKPLGFRLNSPADKSCRGPHISLGHEEAHRIDLALIKEMNVLPDFRKPDNIRLGIPALYTRYVDIYKAVSAMEKIVKQECYTQYTIDNTIVT